MATESPAELYAVGEIDETDPVVIPATLSKLTMAINDSQTVKNAKEIWPSITSAPGLPFDVRCGAQMQSNDPITWCPVQTYIVGVTDKLDIDATGRYISIEFSGEGVGNRTGRFNGFDINYKELGRY
jgi:hypothetical protein